jgi:hypothetical protein
MSETPPPRTADPGPSSPFDVDIGGSQRAELRAQIRTTQLQLTAANEERYLLETQITVLRKVQKEARVAARIETVQRRAIQPVFSAWSRYVAAARADRAYAPTLAALRKDLAAQAATISEKEGQVAALIDRVARVKSNAQSKLSELSDANQQLAAALEVREAELHKMRRRSSGERDALRQLATLRERAAEAEASRETAEAELRGERATGSPRSALHTQLVVALGALSAADAEVSQARAWVLEQRLHAERQAARLEGLHAEAACLKTEAAAQRTLLAINDGIVGGDGVGAVQDESAFAIGQPVVLATPTAEAIELGRYRRALLCATFYGWAAVGRARC